jgi:5-methylcytosine-specific restriction endonuclease McrA
MSFVTKSAKEKKAYHAKYWAANKKRIRRDIRTKFSARYNALKLRCKRQGVEFKISYKVYIDKIKKGCYYCGQSIAKEIGGGVDRRNNNLRNYTARNLVACCAQCNKVKSNVLTWQEMICAMKAVIKFRKTKKKK